MLRYSENWSVHFLHSKESVTQGFLLSVIAYVIGVLPLIREIRDAHPRVTQPWCADDAGGGGVGYLGKILTHFQDLQVRGALWG